MAYGHVLVAWQPLTKCFLLVKNLDNVQAGAAVERFLYQERSEQDHQYALVQFHAET